MKKTIFSGVQPSGNLHIGNYLGAISQWVDMQKSYNCIFCVVDYHAITVRQDPEILRKKITEVAKIYIAAGIDPKKSIIFQQSDISAHAELAWVFNCITKNSDLYKMTQFKLKSGLQNDFETIAIAMKKMTKGWEWVEIIEKAVEDKKLLKKPEKLQLIREAVFKKMSESLNVIVDNFNKVGVGLFDYPVLMAADILLYNTDIVPVGEDQIQHVELARTLGRRFNSQFGETFKIPEVKIKKESAPARNASASVAGGRIMGLDDPAKKMSKSAPSELNYIGLTDEPEIAAKKIMRATTDSGAEIKFDAAKKPGISNLLTIYSLLDNTPVKKLEIKYKNKGYGDFKKDLSQVVIKFLTDFQKKYNKISDIEVKKILDNGAKKARPLAEETLKKVKNKIGIN